MAGDAKAQAVIQLNLATIQQIASVKDAAKAAERELKYVDRQIQKLLENGKTVDTELVRRRTMAEGLMNKNREILQTTQAFKQYETQFADEKKFAAFFRKMAGAQFVKSLFTGEVDAQQAARFLVNRDSVEVLEKAGFVRAGAALARAIPAAMLAMFAVETLRQGFAARDKDTKEVEKLGRDIAAGKLPPALYDVFNREMSKFHVLDAFNKSAVAQKVMNDYFALVKESISGVASTGAVENAYNAAFDNMFKEGKLGAYSLRDLGNIRAGYEEFVKEKQKRENAGGVFQELTTEEQSQLAAEIFARMEIKDTSVIERFAEALEKENKKNTLAKQREKRDAEKMKTPSQLFQEMDSRHEQRVWSSLRRIDVLGDLARSDKRTFVRD